jgi:glycosyltransferase involved in cell wall biosynthesis
MIKAAHPLSQAGLHQPPLHGGWLNVVTHLDPKYGGLSAAVPALANAVSEAGYYSTSIAGFCAAGEQFNPATTNPIAIDHLPLGRLNWMKNSTARHRFHQLVDDSAGVHVHGIWEHSTAAATSRARASKKPYVISAHGMLERWALANKRAKKVLYAALIERANLQSADCLHALTQAEAQDYRNFGLLNPIAVIPNGVNIPAHLSPDLFLERFPDLRGKRLVLFLGRIHFKKGLDLLAHAWAHIAPKSLDTHLVLAGPDSEDTQDTLSRQLTALGLSQRVTFTGMLSQDVKWSALAASECFVLPSYSEGLSVSVLEAMSAGLPVIVTKQCNLPEVEEHNCGWVIDTQVDELVDALKDLLHASSREIADMGANGRHLVSRRYSWPVIGEQMSRVYRWLNGGSVPVQVELHERWM